MANVTIYLPADLAAQVKAVPGFPLSAICQAAVREHFATSASAGPLDTVKTAAGRIEVALSDLKDGISRIEETT